MKHLLKLLDLSTEEIIDLLNLADQLKYERNHHIPHPHLQGKTLGMIFQKASTRTRVSFETGMVQLGGYPVWCSWAVIRCFCPPMICRSAEENPCRIPQEFSPAIWMAL